MDHRDKIHGEGEEMMTEIHSGVKALHSGVGVGGGQRQGWRGTGRKYGEDGEEMSSASEGQTSKFETGFPTILPHLTFSKDVGLNLVLGLSLHHLFPSEEDIRSRAEPPEEQHSYLPPCVWRGMKDFPSDYVN